MSQAAAVLFVVAQPGAANYFAPLWRRWSHAASAPDWRVLLDPVSRRQIGDQDLGPDRILDLDGSAPESSPALSQGWRPTVVVTSTTYSPAERAWHRWATVNGLHTTQLIDAHYDYRRRIEETNGAGVLPQTIIVPDTIAVAEATAEGLPADRLVALGYPAWESIAAAPPADSRRAVFVSQPIASDMGNALGYTERDALAVALEAASPPLQAFDEILLALHPRERDQPPPEHPFLRQVASANEGLSQAGTVLGMFSTFLIEAALAGRRTISLQPGGRGRDMCVLSRQGIIPRVESAAELAATMETPAESIEDFRQAYAGSLERLDAYLREDVS